MSQVTQLHARPDPIVVGCDDGYAQIKVAHFGADGQIQESMIPAQATIGSAAASDTSGNATADTYIADDTTYTVNPHLPAQDTRFAAYPTSALNRVLVHHALREAGLGHTRIRLATGLPPGNYYGGDGKRNSRLINAKQENLMARLETMDPTPLSTIVSHTVLTEGVCGLLDHLMPDDGGAMQPTEEPAVVVDIGGRTTDVLTILPPGTVIDHGQSGTTRTGVLNVKDKVRDWICDRFDLESLKARSVDRALSTREITLYGQSHDVGDLVDAAIEEVSRELLQYVQSRLAHIAEVELVLFIGGGAQLMRPVIAPFPQAVIPDSPTFANARGMAKYLRILHNGNA